jgi:hypothetical protein
VRGHTSLLPFALGYALMQSVICSSQIVKGQDASFSFQGTLNTSLRS